MSFYIATTGAGQLLRVEGFALVSRDEEVLRSISDLRSLHAHCIASPLRTSVAIPLPGNRDALLVHPLQLALDQYDLQWEYIPAHLLSPRDRDTVRLAGTQLYITLDAPQPATLERSLPRIGFDQAHGSDSTGVERQWPVGSPNTPLTPPVVVDLRARRVRIRKGDRDV